MYVIAEPNKGVCVNGRGGLTEMIGEALVFHNYNNAVAYLNRLISTSYSKYSQFTVIALHFPEGFRTFTNWGD